MIALKSDWRPVPIDVVCVVGNIGFAPAANHNKLVVMGSGIGRAIKHGFACCSRKIGDIDCSPIRATIKRQLHHSSTAHADEGLSAVRGNTIQVWLARIKDMINVP